MKKKLIVLLGILIVIALCSLLISAFAGQKEDSGRKVTVVTSFYPMYVLALNIVGDTPNVEVVNLTEPTTGCLHDYQLTASDMMKLEDADIFIMNGGGMENFIQKVIGAYPKLKVINASEGIEFLTSAGHDHGEESNEEEPEGEELNAHVWLNMDDYLRQIRTVEDALAEYDAGNAEAYRSNGETYRKAVEALKKEMETALAGAGETKIIIFHDSFAYLAQELGLQVVHAVDMDSESSLNAGEIAEVVDEVKEEQVGILYTEEQFSTKIADSVSKETGAKVYILDSIVNGAMSGDAYLNAMKENLKVLQESLITK